jgi:hypothetical protein
MIELNSHRSPKKIVLVTTEHSIQENDFSDRGEFRNILLYLLATYSASRIMEEWRCDGSWTIARHIADQRLPGAWQCISPPPDLKLTWPNDDKSRGYRNLDGLLLCEYGPIALQTAREAYMLNQIQANSDKWQTALVIAGCAHQQSLAEKLIELRYEVESFSWIRPGSGSIPDFVSSDWRWVS